MVDDVGRGMVNGRSVIYTQSLKSIPKNNLEIFRLAMTRSIGDLELKPFGVTAIPDVRKIKVYAQVPSKLRVFLNICVFMVQIKHGRDAFLVLTTDGINCVMSDQEICDVIQRTEDPSDAAHCLTDQALHYSSEDNATAVVVPLGSWGK